MYCSVQKRQALKMSKIAKTVEELNKVLESCHKVTAEHGRPVPRITKCQYIGSRIFGSEKDRLNGVYETYWVRTEPHDGDHQMKKVIELLESFDHEHGILYPRSSGYNNIAIWREDDVRQSPKVLLVYETM